uniref:Uncharacterized protein n=1 Tax=Oryza glumipatula TaxID=40148 RepID=A0A0D9Y8I5_9ORYZ
MDAAGTAAANGCSDGGGSRWMRWRWRTDAVVEAADGCGGDCSGGWIRDGGGSGWMLRRRWTDAATTAGACCCDAGEGGSVDAMSSVAEVYKPICGRYDART